MFNTAKYIKVGIALLVVVLFACSPARRVPEGKLLLNKVKVETDNGKVDEDELQSLSRQKPNRRILWFFRFHLWVHNIYKPESESKIKNAVGEPPVIYDSILTKTSRDQMHLSLKNHGFYENEVTYTEKVKRKKVNVKYQVKAGLPYKIRSVSYKIEDPTILNYVLQDTSKSLLKKGTIFDIDKLEAERGRITKRLKNSGYYFFSRNYIFFEADTTAGNREVKLTLGVQNVIKEVSDLDTSKIETQHQRYKVRNIYVYIDNDNRQNDGEILDTVELHGIYFIQTREYDYKPRALERAIFIEIGNYYLLRDQELTYRRLSALRNFKYVNINFEDAQVQNHNRLDCFISLIPVVPRSFTVESNLTNSSGNYGIEGTLGYQDLNLFQGAEILNVRFGGGLEAQQLTVQDNQEVVEELPFNTIEVGPEISLNFPRFLLPFKAERFSKNNNPKTSMSAAYNFQQRPDYTRNLTNFSFLYSWYETKTKQHVIQPLDISFIRLNKSDAFQERLDAIGNSLLTNSYTDHFIMATKYSYILNTQSLNKTKNFHFFRFNVESAGNLLSLINQLANSPTGVDDSYEAFNVRFAQYLRTDIEFKYYFLFENSSLVLRTITGVGKPYGNLDVLPFEKSFFVGGSNDIRAWRARDLGPGSTPKSLTEGDNIDQIGDFKWEGNIEYRFDLSQVFEAAIFSDFGNIWLLEKDDQRPNAEFDISRFWQDMAIGVGVGIRLDFNFFLIRFDAAARAKDPQEVKPERISLELTKTPILNFGIGYPF